MIKDQKICNHAKNDAGGGIPQVCPDMMTVANQKNNHAGLIVAGGYKGIFWGSASNFVMCQSEIPTGEIV